MTVKSDRGEVRAPCPADAPSTSDRRRLEAVGEGHEVGAEAQLDVIDPFATGVLDALVGNPAAGVDVDHHRRQPAEAVDEGHQVGLAVEDLDVGPEALDVGGGERHAVLPGEVEDGLEAQAAVEVPVEVDERQGRVDHGVTD